MSTPWGVGGELVSPVGSNLGVLDTKNEAALPRRKGSLSAEGDAQGWVDARQPIDVRVAAP